MGYDSKVSIRKFEGSTDLIWIGDQNLARYDDEFERFFCLNTKEWFESKSSQWYSSLSCHEYLIKVHEHLQKEEANADFYLQEQTKPKIINIVLTKCVEDKAEDITNMEMGCTHMFEGRKID